MADMGTSLAELKIIGEALMVDGYTLCEAYPVDTWRRNRWPELNRQQIDLLNAFMRYTRLSREYTR